MTLRDLAFTILGAAVLVFAGFVWQFGVTLRDIVFMFIGVGWFVACYVAVVGFIYWADPDFRIRE
jgi:hypothetical protein